LDIPRIALLAVALVACSAPPPPKPVAPSPIVASSTPTIASPPPLPKTSTARLASLDEHAWPPPKVGDSDWVAFERPWLHKLPGAPPTFYRTRVRPDPKRKVEVEVVALDARQLELDMAIGNEGPWPPDEKKNGKFPRFGGKLPREPAVSKRVVAAFNGAFRLDQNAWGMTIRRRVFAPPVPNVASLLMHDDGRLGFGTWGPTMQTPADVRSLRQNLDPLLDDGEIDPRHRKRWGGILKQVNQVGQRAKRTGMCRTAGGHFLYLYGDMIEAADLAVAMKQVGCEYGIHLDMNVLHVGFVFMSFDDVQYKVGKSEVLAPNMGITEKRYIHQPNPKEFFYATLRAPFAAGYEPDGFAQPPPAWLPAIVAHVEGGVRTTRIDTRRVKLTSAAPRGEDAERVLAAIDGASLEGGGDVPVDAAIAAGLTERGDLVIAERQADGSVAEALKREGCVRVMPAKRFERAGRDEIASGGGPRIYVLGAKPPSATYRFDKDDKGELRWPKVSMQLP